MLKVLYAGSPKAAAITLEYLLKNTQLADCGVEIVGVLTNPPSMQKRHHDLIPTPVHAVASQHEIPVFSSRFNIAAGTGVQPRYFGKRDG